MEFLRFRAGFCRNILSKQYPEREFMLSPMRLPAPGSLKRAAGTYQRLLHPDSGRDGVEHDIALRRLSKTRDFQGALGAKSNVKI